MIHKIYCLIIILLTASCSNNKINNINGSVDESKPKKVPGLYYSENVDDEFVIYLNLPSGYNDSASDGFHVVYLLDGDWYFDGSHERLPNGGTVEILSNLTDQGTLPQIITVGIGYPNENLRQRDFLYPNSSSNPISGGGENFYNFLKDELIPQIDSSFNTQKDNGRTLIGHSYGGYFAMFSLFHYRPGDPVLFNNYLAISPANYYRSYYLKTMENFMALEINNILPLNLFMTVGDLEWAPMQNGIDTFVNRLNSRNYDDFDFNWIRYVNLNHGTVVRPSISDGLIWLFNH